MSESYEFKGEYYKQSGDLERVIPVTFSAPSLPELFQKYQDHKEKGEEEGLKFRKIHIHKVTREEIDW